MGNCLGQVLSEADSRVAALQAENAQLRAALAGGGGGGTAPPQHGVPSAGGERVLDVLFFPDPAMPCRNGSNCRRNNCTYTHERTNLVRLLQALGSARQELLVCVFNITCNELADALLAAHKRGVAVRVITDDEQMRSQGSDVQQLAAAGIPVRHDADSFHMHNKFVTIDGAILITGSFNWTRQAVLSNQENLVILQSAQAVGAFKGKFEQLWQKYARNG